METAIIGGVIGLLNLVILFELNRMTNEMAKLRDKFDDIVSRVTTIEAEITACPSCRESSGR